MWRIITQCFCWRCMIKRRIKYATSNMQHEIDHQNGLPLNEILLTYFRLKETWGLIQVLLICCLLLHNCMVRKEEEDRRLKYICILKWKKKETVSITSLRNRKISIEIYVAEIHLCLLLLHLKELHIREFHLEEK